MSDTSPRCAHFATGDGICGAPFARLYGPGLRCPDHTPARLAGRPETIPDPALTMDGLRAAAGLDPAVSFTPAGETVIDIKAKASGKRRSSPEDYRAAQATANATWGKPDLSVVGKPHVAAAAGFTPESLTRQARKVYDALADGQWHTLRELSDASGAPEASVSARLRDLRSADGPALPLEATKIDGSNLWRYRLTVPAQATA